MLEYAIAVMLLIITASVFQTQFKIPAPVTLLSVALILNHYGLAAHFSMSNTTFDQMVILCLPLLIATDALKLSFKDIKSNGVSLFWLAVISVVISVVIGMAINKYVLVDYPLTIAAVALLFAMVSATDPVTVSAIFAHAGIPHKLKLITEGESLFNDATALIIFSIALTALYATTPVSFMGVAALSFKVIALATAIGLFMGALTVQALKMSSDALIETVILLVSAGATYLITEHWHASGILAVIIAMLMANNKIQQIIQQDAQDALQAERNSKFYLFRHAVTNKTNMEAITKNIDFLSLFASSLLFIEMAAIINIPVMLSYWKEILIIFIVTTLIRGAMMVKFAFVSNKTSRMQNISYHWWLILTFAGTKGAISVLMVHMIPAYFPYKELFENIIFGNILLSIFVYAAVLEWVLWKYKARFAQETAAEHTH